MLWSDGWYHQGTIRQEHKEVHTVPLSMGCDVKKGGTLIGTVYDDAPPVQFRNAQESGGQSYHIDV